MSNSIAQEKKQPKYPELTTQEVNDVCDEVLCLHEYVNALTNAVHYAEVSPEDQMNRKDVFYLLESIRGKTEAIVNMTSPFFVS